MGGACSTGPGVANTPQAAQNDAIELQMAQDRLASLFHFKIILLGAGESGKSTVVKQLRLIHKQQHTEDELKSVVAALHSNVYQCIMSLIKAAEEFLYVFNDDEAHVVEIIKARDPLSTELLSMDSGMSIRSLFYGETIEKTYARRAEYWLLDACSYYMENLLRFVRKGFVPTDEDILMARVRTTGMVSTNLEQKRVDPKPYEPTEIKFQVVDVGGQRSERKKWIHCFSDTKAVFFVVSLAGYNQVLFEDPDKNRMEEALALFADTVKTATFRDTPIVLFLNKKDLFEKMIRKTDLSKLFPEYQDGPDVLAAIDFVAQKFKSHVPKGRNISVHVVSGVVKRDIRYAFQDVQKELIELNKDAIASESEQVRRRVEKLAKRNEKNKKALASP